MNEIDTLSTALAAGIKILKETNAATIKYTPKNKAGQPLATCIIVYGKAETAEILKAIEAIEEKWHE